MHSRSMRIGRLTHIAHLYHYHGEEEEEIWSVDKQNDGYFENKDIDMMMVNDL